MDVPRIDLYTDGTSTASPAQPAPSGALGREVAFSGASRAIHELYPRLRGPPVTVHPLSSAMRRPAWLDGHTLPVLCVEGRIVLEGTTWSEAAVRDAVRKALDGARAAARGRAPEGPPARAWVKAASRAKRASRRGLR